MKRVLSVLTVFIAGAIIFFQSGCSKNEDKPTVEDAQDHLTAESLFDDVYRQFEKVVKENDQVVKSGTTGIKSTFEDCPAITITPFDTTWPKTIVIDYGTENCTGPDGRDRRGIILAVASGPYREEGSIFTVSTEDFYLNDYRVEGVKTIVNEGYEGPNLVFGVTVEDGLITRPDGGVITYQSSRTRTWISGAATFWPNIWDDIYLIDGTASGTSANGVAYTMQTTEPLIVALACPWIEDGIIEYIPGGAEPRYLDYGDGECDASAVVRVGEYTFNIILP